MLRGSGRMLSWHRALPAAPGVGAERSLAVLHGHGIFHRLSLNQLAGRNRFTLFQPEPGEINPTSAATGEGERGT